MKLTKGQRTYLEIILQIEASLAGGYDFEVEKLCAALIVLQTVVPMTEIAALEPYIDTDSEEYIILSQKGLEALGWGDIH